MTIPELIEKLEKATGPDREFDADIAVTLKMIAEREWWSVNYLSGDMIPAYTASIDAAVQLCELVLTRHDLLIEQYAGEWVAVVRDRFEKTAFQSRTNCKNGAIATCQAILRALQPKEGE